MTQATPTSTSPRRGTPGVLPALARIQARRYLRHPVFLVPLAFLLLGAARTLVTGESDSGGWDQTLSWALWLGVPGVVVGYRLTVTEDRALSLLSSAPTDQRTRTLALYVACLVPVVTCLVLMALHGLVDLVHPPPPQYVVPDPPGQIGWVDYVFSVAEAPVACFGGPVLGVTVGRWVRFPGAGVLTAVVLFVVELVGLGFGEVVPGVGETWPARLVVNLQPYVYWGAADENRTFTELRPGSPAGHLVYALALCGLAIVAGLLRGAGPRETARLRRVGGALLAVAAASFLWALLG